jgi:membrane protein YdbS with pleckstrin-like domain
VPDPKSTSNVGKHRRIRDGLLVGSVLAIIVLSGVALYLPQAWRPVSLFLYGLVCVLVIVTFVVPAIVRARRSAKEKRPADD